MGRQRRPSSRTLLVALGLSTIAAFALLLDFVDPGQHRAVVTICLVVAAATAFQMWHTARVREKAMEGEQIREQHVERHYHDLKSADSDH